MGRSQSKARPHERMSGKRPARDKRNNLPRMLFADDQGNIYDHPYLLMAGYDGFKSAAPRSDELIPLSELSKLFYLPQCPPIGFDQKARRHVRLTHTKIDGVKVRCHAVAAFMEPGFARIMLPAADYSGKDYNLPMWAYTAAGFTEDGYVASGFQVEYNHTWDPLNYDDLTLPEAVSHMTGKYHDNRLVRHLANCAVHNHCFAAKNFFWRRWEAPLPVSRSCNAQCLGCISLQPAGSCAASHDRIAFRPLVKEISEIAVEHLNEAPGPIVSFGQGCEGEPLTEGELIAESVREIRKKTDKGSINLNTNGSLPEKVSAIIDAGLDCIRVSMNSVRPELYRSYYRPKGYDFSDVVRTISMSVDRGVYTMINYLIFPGVTDQQEELETLFELIRKTGVNFIHFKNLCVDPDLYLKAMKNRGDSLPVGIKKASVRIQQEFPDLQIGYFNQPGFKVRQAD